MLTDIFSVRYAGVQIWQRFGEIERRLIVQGFRLLGEQICPYFVNGKEGPNGKKFWSELHSRLSMELGLNSLSTLGYSYIQKRSGLDHTVTGLWTINVVCENWMLQSPLQDDDPDRFIKERLSLVEIGFRMRGDEIATANASLEGNIAHAHDVADNISRLRGLKLPGLPGDIGEGIRATNAMLNAQFSAAIQELNTRFRQAGCNLHYHNGFIQQLGDGLTSKEIELPFWPLVSSQQWANVDLDIKEAINLRDTGGPNPAFYAARALESTIKIISDNRAWTHGGEKGAHNYIDNLSSRKARFIEQWEAEQLKMYFSNVRNPLGHGPGSKPMHVLTNEQTDWAIDFALASIKSLIRRF